MLVINAALYPLVSVPGAVFVTERVGLISIRLNSESVVVITNPVRGASVGGIWH